MKLAIFTNILNPYRSSFFDALYHSALKYGDEIRVFSMVNKKDDRPWKYADYERSFTRLLKGFTLHFRFGGFIHFNTNVVKELKEFSPDIVVMAGAYIQPTNLLIINMRKKMGYKTVFWSESHLNESRSYGIVRQRIREWFRRVTLNKMDAFWYPGIKAEEFIDCYRDSKSRKIKVPNTVDNEFFNSFHLRKELHQQYPKVLFTPARLTHVKGLLQFLDILKRIPANMYCWKIAGDGPLETELCRVAERYGCNIELLGLKSQEQIRELYSMADIFVLPSLSDPNPLSCIEALWMGLPLFVSEHVGNYPETVIDGVNGYVFSYLDLEDAYQKLSRILTADRDWFEKASIHSFELARLGFDMKEIANRVVVETKNLL